MDVLLRRRNLELSENVYLSSWRSAQAHENDFVNVLRGVHKPLLRQAFPTKNIQSSTVLPAEMLGMDV